MSWLKCSVSTQVNILLIVHMEKLFWYIQSYVVLDKFYTFACSVLRGVYNFEIIESAPTDYIFSTKSHASCKNYPDILKLSGIYRHEKCCYPVIIFGKFSQIEMQPCHKSLCILVAQVLLTCCTKSYLEISAGVNAEECVWWPQLVVRW